MKLDQLQIDALPLWVALVAPLLCGCDCLPWRCGVGMNRATLVEFYLPDGADDTGLDPGFLGIEGTVVEDEGEPIPFEVAFPLNVTGDGYGLSLETVYWSENSPCSMMFELTFSILGVDQEPLGDGLYPSFEASWDGICEDYEPWSGSLLSLCGELSQYCHVL